MWNVQTKVIPVVIGALGMVSKRLVDYLGGIGVGTLVEKWLLGRG